MAESKRTTLIVSPKKSPEKFKQRVFAGFVIVFLLMVCFLVLYPLVFALSAAFTPGTSVSVVGIIPFSNGFTFNHYIQLFTKTNYFLWFRNTFLIASGTSLATIAICTLAAYVFSRFRFPFKKSLMLSLLILQIFPSFIGMIAIYVILLRIGGLDTLWGVILIYVAGNIPYNTWLVKSYVDTIPKALDESARIDGASHFMTFRKIIFPLSKPIIIFLAVTSFTGPWMEFIFSKLILRSNENQTLALGLFSFVTEKKNEFTTFCAGAILIAIPFIIFFIITQKMLITSLGSGAVKE